SASNERFRCAFHLLSQHRLASMRVTLETDLAHCASDTFGDSENNPGRAAFLVDGIDTKLDAYVGESPRLINVDDFLTRLFQMLFVNRLIQSYFDFLAQSLRLDPFGAGDFDLAYNRPRLNGNDHLHAVAFRLSKDSNVPNVTGFVQRFDILLHDLVCIGLANFRAHLR